ncbi:acyl-CoA dehydrogenase family protein [Halopolyspora algeriensis]|nr:acyl-CoA dehydrogenase family protein [Halopolyspora algeriensis]
MAMHTDYQGREKVAAFFGAHAAAVDRCESDIRPGIRMLGELGLLDLGVPDTTQGRLASMLLVVEDVASACLSSAFALWAQRMVIDYLSSSDRPASTSELAGLRAGTRIGATAIAPAMRHVAGLEPVPVVATRTSSGVRLNGPINWASNLFDDALVAVPARFEDGSGMVVHVRTTDPGVTVHSAPDLLTLGATASSSVTLTDVEVPAAAILSEDLPGFVRSFRPTLLLIQSAYCSGLTGASRHHIGERLTGLNAEFTDDFAELAQRHDSVRRRLFDFAQAPHRSSSRDLLRLRLGAARTAGEATGLEATVRGGAGYVASSGTSRRLREAAFLPIQAPTEGQLRWHLAQFE